MILQVRLEKLHKNRCDGQLKELTLNDLPLFQEHVRIKHIQIEWQQ